MSIEGTFNFTNTTSHLRAFADEIQIIVDHCHENSESSSSSFDDREEDDDEEDESWTIYETISFRVNKRLPSVKFEVLKNFIENFSDSIENLRLEEVNFNHGDEFYELLENLVNLKRLDIIKCEMYNLSHKNSYFQLDNDENLSVNEFKNLKTLIIYKSNRNFENAFNCLNKIESIQIIDLQ